MGKTNFTGNPEVVVVPTTLPEIMNFTVPVVSYNWVVEVLYGTQSILVNPWDSAYNPGEVPGHISNSTFNIPVPDAPLPWWYEYTTTTS